MQCIHERCVLYWYYLVEADFSKLFIEHMEKENLRAVRPAPISTACRDGSHPSEATWPREASKHEGTQVLGPSFEHIVTEKGNSLGPKAGEKDCSKAVQPDKSLPGCTPAGYFFNHLVHQNAWLRSA